jgi:hypothetical protein
MDYTLAIRQLAAHKHNMSLVKGAMDEMVAQVTSSARYLAYQEQAAAGKEKIAELDAQIRDNAEREMTHSGTKPDHPAVKVQKTTDYKITNSTAAFEWCLKNLPGALLIDEAKLIKYMREFVEDAALPPFMTVLHGFRTTISPDLSKYREDDDAPGF